MENQTVKKNFVRKIPSIIGIVVCVILVPILIMNLTIIIKSYINPNKTPDFFGIKPFIVETDSMVPEIRGGDLAVTKTVDPAKLREGDIISFKEESGTVVTHRILALTEKNGEPAFTTGGDDNKDSNGNQVIDTESISWSQVEGIYLFKISALGYLAMFMQKPLGMFVFVGIPLCAFIIYDIIRRRFTERRNAEKDNESQAEIERLKAELAEKEAQKSISEN